MAALFPSCGWTENSSNGWRPRGQLPSYGAAYELASPGSGSEMCALCGAMTVCRMEIAERMRPLCPECIPVLGIEDGAGALAASSGRSRELRAGLSRRPGAPALDWSDKMSVPVMGEGCMPGEA